MSAVVNSTTAANSAASSANGLIGSSVQETQDRFLKLLVTQLRNQDPLNPMDNAQVTTQMAQLSTVSGIEKLNATLQAMATSQSLQAASMIGHGVLAPGSGIELAGGMAFGGFSLDQPVDKLVVTIKDSNGNTLHKVDLGAQKAGVTTFQWDGATDSGATAADGTYKFEVSAVQGGKDVTADALALAKVDSVTLGSNGVMLNTSQLGALDLNQVKQIF